MKLNPLSSLVAGTNTRYTLPLALILVTQGHLAFATQGTMPHGYGVKSEGMGGVVMALPQDALVGASNPAGMASLETRFDIGLALLKADNGADFAGQNLDGSADTDLYIIPQMGFAYRLDDKAVLGLSVVGNGVGTDYDSSANAGGLQEPGSAFQQMVATFSYAYQLSERHQIGVGLLGIYQTLEIEGTNSIGLQEGDDSAFGAGLRLGWLGQLTPEVSAGAAYTTRGYMQKMDTFDQLLAEQGDMDMPATWAVGIAYQKGPWSVGLDAQHIYWSDVKSFGNPGVTRATGAPGSDNGAGFGWDDQTVWRLGAAYEVNEKLTLRAGYNDANQLLNSRDTYLGILAPAANHEHVTIGTSWKLANNGELSFAYARSFEGKVKGTGAAPDSLTDPYMSQHWFSFSYGVPF